MLESVLAQPALNGADQQMRYVVSDWLKAGDAVQRTVAHLSRQLRRFLDDQAYLQNRRIAELIREIEAAALNVRDGHLRGVRRDPRSARGRVDAHVQVLHDASDPVHLAEVEVVEADDEVELDAPVQLLHGRHDAVAQRDRRIAAGRRLCDAARGDRDHGCRRARPNWSTTSNPPTTTRGVPLSTTAPRQFLTADDRQVAADIPTVIFVRNADG
ncbi:MAG: DUF3375 family protein [Micrococcales bacterium]|nr:DUF3375 family protein [Micrococcales bacterium]